MIKFNFYKHPHEISGLAHGYFNVDLEVVWKTIERDLPELEVMVEALLKLEF